MEEIKQHQTKKQLLGEIGRFLLIGGFATIVDYIVYFVSTMFIFKSIDSNWNIVISTLLGFTAGLIINWIFSARFVYRYEKKTTNKQFLIYVALCVAGLLLTELGMLLSSPIHDKLIFQIFGINITWELFFKCLMTGIVLVLNYLGRKFLIFKK